MGILHDKLNLQAEFTSKGHEEALLAALDESLQMGNAQRATLAQMYGEAAWGMTDEELLAFMKEAQLEYDVAIFASSNFDASQGMFTTGTVVDTTPSATTDEYNTTLGTIDVDIITKPKNANILRTIGAYGTASTLRTDSRN
jgi:hypothetical protein